MSVSRRRGIGGLGTAVLALVAFAAVAAQPALAQTRSMAILADVPTLMPAPYHPHMAGAVYSSSLYESGGAHYWH